MVAPLAAEDREFVDRVATLQRAGDWDGIEAFVGFTKQPCVTDPPQDASPACREGEPSGTPVDAFFYGFCHSAFWRAGDRETFIGRPDGGNVSREMRFYGAFTESMFDPLGADYHIVFALPRQPGGSVTDDILVWFGVIDGRIVEQSKSCSQPPFRGPAAYMVPPA
jgi:hypothetical protein